MSETFEIDEYLRSGIPVKVLTPRDFPRLVGELVRNDPELSDVKYTASFPSEVSEVPCIVYRLFRRTPGVDGVETLKPRYRGPIWKNEDGSLTELRAQWMTCVYQFDICTQTGADAAGIVEKFDYLMRRNVGLFMSLGAKDVLFDEEIAPYILPRTGDIYAQSIRWRAILQHVELVNRPSIEEIRTRIFLPDEETVEEVVRGPDTAVLDKLKTTHIKAILGISRDTPSGVARTFEFIEGVDFILLTDDRTFQSAIKWAEAGRRPNPGEKYYVRLLHWTGITTIYLPAWLARSVV